MHPWRFTTEMFTEQEKIDIRRYCGFPVFGQTTSVVSFGYRYLNPYLTLEYRMNNLTVDEENTVRNVYLANLYVLEAAIPASVSNLDTDRAAVWYHNKDEVADKFRLYKLWSQLLQDFFSIEGPARSMQGVRMVV